MYRQLARLGLALMTLCLGSAWLQAPARADVTLSVSPSLVELRVTPEGEGSFNVSVANDGNEPFGVTASVEPYKQATGDGSAAGWLKVDPPALQLQPGQRETVTVTVTVPANVAAGGRYAMIGFKTGPVQVDGGSAGSTAVAGQLGVPVMIDVDAPGQRTRAAALTRLVPVLEADDRIGFRAALANTGTLHVNARGGTIEVSRADGSPAGRLELAESTAVLPGSTELLQAVGSLPLDEAAGYQARASLDWGGDAPATAEASFSTRASLQIVELGARESAERGPTIRLGLRNDGDVGLAPRIQLGLRDSEGRIVGTTTPPQPPTIPAGESIEIESQLPRRLSSGDYEVLANVAYGARGVVERQASFRVGAPAPATNPAWGEAPARTVDRGPGISWWALAAAGLLVVLVAVGTLWLPTLQPLRRRVRRAALALREAE